MSENIRQAVDEESLSLPEINTSRKSFNLTNIEWQRMAKNIYGRLEYERDVSKDVQYEEYLKNGSREMTKNWNNTVEKIRQRKLAALKKKEEQKKAEG